MTTMTPANFHSALATLAKVAEQAKLHDMLPAAAVIWANPKEDGLEIHALDTTVHKSGTVWLVPNPGESSVPTDDATMHTAMLKAYALAGTEWKSQYRREMEAGLAAARHEATP